MKILRGAGLLVFLLTFAACGGSGQAASESASQQFSVRGNPTVMVTSDAGSISVSTGADDSVKITAKKHAPSSDVLKQMQVSLASQGDQVRATYQAGDDHRQRSVDFTITAPKSARLQLQTAGGAVSVSGLANAVSARTGGGSITIKDQRGSVSAETGGGSITIYGTLTGDNTATTGGGSITVTIPSDSALRVNATTSGGTISTDFGLAVSGLGSQTASGAIGDGSKGSLTLRTGGGSIALRKR